MRNVGSRRERKPVMKDTNKRTIAVAGIGYVGMSIATLLSKYNKVILVDTIEEKVNKIKEKKSTVKDEWIEKYLLTEKLDLNATTDAEQAYTDAEYIVIATPTNYDPGRNYFDTASIESVIDIVQAVNPDAIIVIKSTVPIGYTKLIKKKKMEMEKRITKLESDIEKYKQDKREYGNIITLSGHFIIEYGDKAWVLYAGNHNVLSETYTNYETYKEHIKYYYNKGIKIYDQFGTIGDLRRENPLLGLHEFKKKFGGDYVEFVGEFDLILNKPMYFIFTRLVPIYRNIIKNIAKKTGKR